MTPGRASLFLKVLHVLSLCQISRKHGLICISLAFLSEKKTSCFASFYQKATEETAINRTSVPSLWTYRNHIVHGPLVTAPTGEVSLRFQSQKVLVVWWTGMFHCLRQWKIWLVSLAVPIPEKHKAGSRLVGSIFFAVQDFYSRLSLSSLTNIWSFYFRCYINEFITVIIFMAVCTKSIWEKTTKILSLTKLYSAPFNFSNRPQLFGLCFCLCIDPF